MRFSLLLSISGPLLHIVVALIVVALPSIEGSKQCSFCCSALNPLAPYLSFPGSSVYINESTGIIGNTGYWSSLQSEFLPACRFTLISSKDLATAVRILLTFKCQFAIRSGGHMAWKGASNYDGSGKDGVTIDLSAMNTVKVLPSWIQNGVNVYQEVAKIGPGARWRNVYVLMDQLAHAVPGGELFVELGTGAPDGHPYNLGEVTTINSVELMRQAQQIFDTIFADFNNVKAFASIFVIQPIHRAILASSENSGGNILGLASKDGNLIWLAILLSWDDPAFDNAIKDASKRWKLAVNSPARKLGVSHPFIYLNYALASDDPISSYGPVNVQRLQAASQKYDPGQVFQRLVPGGFKLPRSGPW